MAYIAPNTDVKLLKGIALDNRYAHTYYFSDASSQASFFTGKAFATYSAQSYQRSGRNSIKLSGIAENLCMANYMMFRNTSFGSKWFYAFINHVEYINNSTVEIFYEIDVMQTWFVGATLGQCYVERMHISKSEDDALSNAACFTPEPFDASQMLLQPLGEIKWTDYSYLVFHKASGQGQIINGIYSGVDITQCSSAAEVNAVLADYEDTPEDVVQILMFPTELVNIGGSVPGQFITINKPSTLAGHTPRNKKLLNYPFNICEISTNVEQPIELRFEYIGANPATTSSFNVYAIGNIVGNGEVVIGLDFAGAGTPYQGAHTNWNHTTAIASFPQCSFTIDGYRAWLAQLNGKQLVREWQETQANLERDLWSNRFGFVGEALGLIAGSRGGVGGAIAGAGNILSSGFAGMNREEQINRQMGLAAEKAQIDIARAKMQPDYGTMVHTQGSTFLIHEAGVFVRQRSLTTKEAERLDNFLDAYGYQVENVITPNISSRSKANFIKTRGCVVNGEMPTEARKAIGDIIDGGITFWKSSATIGDYSNNV